MASRLAVVSSRAATTSQGLALAPPWADPGASVSVVLGLEGAGAREVEVVGLRGA